MASTVEIVNRALQLLGATRITSISENTRNARVMNLALDPTRLAELEKHVWGFAKKRVRLAADATPPAFGLANRFPLPADFIRLAPRDPRYNYDPRDIVREGNYLLSNTAGPLDIIYIGDVTDANQMSPTFREAWAAKLAEAGCEAITQSNAKKADALAAYKTAIAEARHSDAIQKPPAVAVEDDWVRCRL